MPNYYVAGILFSSELYYHGIKGQKWGVRRFQNPDGTLTPAGRERYGKNALQTTDSVSDASKAAYHYIEKYSKNRKYAEQFDSLLNKTNFYSDKTTKQMVEYGDASDSLNHLFDVYGEKYEKEVGRWTGDGTEMHWELEKRYPEYKKASERHEKAADVLCKTIQDYVKSGLCDHMFADKNIPSPIYQYVDKKYRHITSEDKRAEVLAYIVGDKIGGWNELPIEMEYRNTINKKY